MRIFRIASAINSGRVHVNIAKRNQKLEDDFTFHDMLDILAVPLSDLVGVGGSV